MNNYSDDIFIAIKFYGQNSREIIPRDGNTVEARALRYVCPVKKAIRSLTPVICTSHT